MTIWFERTPGSVVHMGKTDPSTLLLGDTVPDWVQVPDELGGSQVKVLRAEAGSCPGCDSAHVVRHLVLDSPLGVAECRDRGFLWYAAQECEDGE
jgi:hypothetical protein